MENQNWIKRALLNALRQLAETPPNVDAAIKTIRYALGEFIPPDEIDTWLENGSDNSDPPA